MTQFESGRRVQRGSVYLLASAFFLGSALSPLVAFGQASKSKRPGLDVQKISGKVASVEKKGRAAKLTVTKDDGDPLEINITPKTAFAVVAPADTTFLRPNHMVSAEALMSNDKLFSGAFTVYVGIKPDAKFVKDANSESVFQICGTITRVERECVYVDFGGDNVQQILFEQAGAVKVTVNSGDAGLATEGAAVEVEGTTKAGKFLPSKVTVTLENPLKPDDVFGSDKTKSAAKTKPAPKSTKTKSKSGDAPASGDPAVEVADPFGVKKPAPKGKAAKGTDKAADNSGDKMEKK